MTGTAAEWIRDGRGQPLPEELSVAFDAYLRTLPWLVSSLDWSRMPRPEVINVVEADASQFRAWLEQTAIGAHSHVAVWYSREEGGLIVPAMMSLDQFDELYWGAPGVRYSFGVTIEDGRLSPAYWALLEYGRGDIFTAVSRAS